MIHTSFKKAIKENQPLTREEEVVLITKYKDTGCKKSLDRLVLSQIRYIIKCANKETVSKGIEFEDAFQSALVGVMQAIEKFDLSKNLRLFTYAFHWINAQLKNNAYGANSVVRLPSGPKTKTLFYNIKKEQVKLSNKLGREPDITELTIALNEEHPATGCTKYTTEEVEDMINITSRPDIHLDAPLGSHSRSTGLDLLSQGSENETAEALQDKDQYLLIQKAMNSCLSTREKDILEKYFFLEMNNKSIATDFGISAERTRQLRERALKKLRINLAV